MHQYKFSEKDCTNIFPLSEADKAATTNKTNYLTEKYTKRLDYLYNLNKINEIFSCMHSILLTYFLFALLTQTFVPAPSLPIWGKTEM